MEPDIDLMHFTNPRVDSGTIFPMWFQACEKDESLFHQVFNELMNIGYGFNARMTRR